MVRLDSLEEAVDRIKSMHCCNDMRQRVEQNRHRHHPSSLHDADKSQSYNDSTGTIPILGIEIDPTSISLEQCTFPTSTAFMMGNEGQGMTKKQMECCDGFLRIEQYGGGTASLNVSVAVGVVLHRFFRGGKSWDGIDLFEHAIVATIIEGSSFPNLTQLSHPNVMLSNTVI
eukprot:CCRYP_007341-RA/>CCRYP_007341-RA protein AED:0.23 eAED:0.25 QI:0/0/0.5/1/0/0/2/166/171